MKCVSFVNVVGLPADGIGTVTAGSGLIWLPVYACDAIAAIFALLKLYLAIVTATLPAFGL